MKCEKNKEDKDSRQTKLIAIPTGERPFKEIAMNFDGEIPGWEGFKAILVVIDQFTKVQGYIPAMSNCTAEDVANSYINNIWRLCSLPKHITSNGSLQFASKFQQEWN